MKKGMLLLTLVAVLIILTGCGQESTGGAGGSFATEDLSLTVNGVTYRIGDNIDTVVASLGEGYEYSEGLSCDYDGLDKTYEYGVANFYTNPIGDGDLLGEVYTVDPSVTSSKGIKVGDSRDNVIAAYGEDCEDSGDLLIYSVGGVRPYLCFELESDGTVWAIYLTSQSV